jgi:hypothetical protein
MPSAFPHKYMGQTPRSSFLVIIEMAYYINKKHKTDP